ncbi:MULTISPECIES: thioesterase family protein [unclassified Brenneria]|uniref:thioesterase family protein n=1 Tax=unclassified Brenneria TaxID=2634434 RepID=UPI0015578DF7|nr:MULTISPECIES: thioesterase family protein [unclassified Brenneria]MBJ7223050.1 thioesterase family protein [Brenneria sp. L3-3C-1]MEE3644289.1 thioesterase family protein [Brenneria sp. L3_3C_1]MEE3652514.1 thioesterase family protein [Brenneria sp. HEZEL_4_2_4]NPD02470.1 thioesterase family protein [Brenneria sp. hezel4-2-4]
MPNTSLTQGAVLTRDTVRQLVADIFIYKMPFNSELGLELQHFDTDRATLTFTRQDKLIGNALQKILHGGVIAAGLDVAAGLVCVGNTLLRHETISEQEFRQRLSRMGTIDMRVDYLRPGHGEYFTITSQLLRGGNKIAVARAELHNQQGSHIASATATYIVG